MKKLSRRAHGIADYLIVVLFLSLPLALGFTGTARALAYALAFGHLLVTGFSSFPPGAFPLLPHRVHALVETVVGVFLIASPWLLRFAGFTAARNSFMLIGSALLCLAVFTDFDRRRRGEPRPPGDRRRRWSGRKG